MQMSARLRPALSCQPLRSGRPLLASLIGGALACSLLAGGPALAQNAAVVNGKAIPTATGMGVRTMAQESWGAGDAVAGLLGGAGGGGAGGNADVGVRW